MRVLARVGGGGERMSWFISLCMARAATEKFIKTTGLINTIDGVCKSTNTYTHTHRYDVLKQMFWYVSNIQMNCESVTVPAEGESERMYTFILYVYIIYENYKLVRAKTVPKMRVFGTFICNTKRSFGRRRRRCRRSIMKNAPILA